jgi:phosphohistidine phosphatase SixA
MIPRRLVVMRHAKSSWKQPYSSDHERPLKGRGRREALRAAQELGEIGWLPDLVLSSDSARTQETWACMTEGIPEPLPRVDFTRALYHAGLDSLKSVLEEVDDEIRTILVLGHNPGWEEVVERLSGQTYVVMNTAHAALLTAPAGGWADCLAREGAWKLERVINPRGLLE